MQDLISLGTGNSRYLKSAIPAGTSWESALAMLIAGTFPIDLNGINEAGISQLGTALTKANLLKDATAESLGGNETMVPDEALVALKKLIDGNVEAIAKGVKMEIIERAGTGNSRLSLTFSFKPKVWFRLIPRSNDNNRYKDPTSDHWISGLLWEDGKAQTIFGGGNTPTLAVVSYSGNTVTVTNTSIVDIAGWKEWFLAVGWEDNT